MREKSFAESGVFPLRCEGKVSFIPEDGPPAACLSVSFHSLLTGKLLRLFLHSPVGLVRFVGILLR